MDEPRPTADLTAIPSWDAVRKAITDSYYDTRTEGGTMETAANLAATRVQNLWSEVVVALARAASRPVGEEGLRASHREAIWDERGYHPGYGKGVCEYDGEPWPCKHWRAALATKPSPDEATELDRRGGPDYPEPFEVADSTKGGRE